jgi:hypothetical protein
MFQPGDVAKVAVVLFAADSLVKLQAGVEQDRKPESFVADALRVLNEGHKATTGDGGVAKYLANLDEAPKA